MMRFVQEISRFAVGVAGVASLLFLPWPALVAMSILFAAWMAFSLKGRQAASLAAVGLRTLGRRMGASFVIVIGIAGVTAVLVAMLAMAHGYRETLRRTGSADTAIVLRGGSASEVMSVLSLQDSTLIEAAPGVARDRQGRPLASAETIASVDLPLKGGNPDIDIGSVQLRGIGESAWRLRTHARVVEGRRFRPGTYELMVGSGARAHFAGLDVGKEIKLANQVWKVVGEFSTRDALDSEIWTDAKTLGDVYRRGSSVSTVVAKLESAAAYDAFRKSLQGNPRLRVSVETTESYFGRLLKETTRIITVLAMLVGTIMAIGASFGCLNTMYAAIENRASEIATLRAIGFGGTPVVVAILLEAMVLALIGGLLGGAIAWLFFDGNTASTLAAGTTGQLTFHFDAAPEVLWVGVKWALAIGFFGGLYPALRAARGSVAAALRES
jgi:putative ABC transport system permease protein